MANSFDINAQLKLQAPTNIDTIASNIKSKLTGISATIDIIVPTGTSTKITNLNKRLVDLTTNLANVSTNAAQAAAAIQSIGSSLTGTSTKLNSLQQYLKSVSSGFANIGKNVNPAADTIEHFGAQSALAARRFTAFTVAAGAIVGIVSGIKAGLSEAIAFQQQIVKIGQITQQSTSTLKPLVDEVTRLSTTLGVSSKSLIEISNTLAQAGFSAKDTKVAMEALAKTTLAPTFGDIKNTVEAAIASTAQFKLSAQDLEKSLGSINAVAAAFAVEAQDLTTIITKTGGVFKTLSGDLETPTTQLNQLIALFTSVRQTTRESADVISTGFRTIFGRLERPETIQFLETFGVKLTDMKGKFIGVFPAIEQLNKALKDLDPQDVNYARIVEQIGGLRQISRVIPLIQQFPVALRALSVAQAGQNSLTIDAIRSQEAFAQKLARVKEQYLDLFRIISQNQTLRAISNIFLEIATSVAQVTKALQPLVPLLVSVAAFKGFSAGSSFVKGFYNYFTTQGVTRRSQGGEIPGYSSGGPVGGYGTGDTVPAMLEPKEFVIRKSSTQKVGRAVLKHINDTGELPQKRGFGDSIDEYIGTLKRESIGGKKTALTNYTPSSLGLDKYSSAELKDFEILKNLKKYLRDRYIGNQQTPRGLSNIIKYLQVGGHQIYNSINKDSGLVDQIRKLIPNEKSVELLGAGVYGAAIGQPGSKNVFRIGVDSGITTDSFKRDSSNLTLQALETQKVGNLIVEKLPYAQSLKDIGFSPGGIDLKGSHSYGSRITSGLLTKFQDNIIKKGLNDKDIHYGNIGFFNRKLISIDPDAIGFARGGKIPGYGSGDSIPALLTPEEFVIKKDSAQSVGYSNLRYINEQGKLPGYNKGGTVAPQKMALGDVFNRKLDFQSTYSGLSGAGQAKLQEEISLATKRLLDTLGNEYTEAQKNNKSRQAFDRALKYGDKIVTDSFGKMIGLGRTIDFVRNKMEFQGKVTQEVSASLGSGLLSRLGGKAKLGLGAAGIGAALVGPQAIEDIAGKERSQAITAGFSGALSGGFIGGQVGGPLGAAIGAIAFGLSSFISTQKDLKREEVRTKSAEKLEGFNQVLSGNINQPGLSVRVGSAITGSQGILNTLEKQAEEESKKQGYFGSNFLFSDLVSTEFEKDKTRSNFKRDYLRTNALSGYAVAQQNLEKTAFEARSIDDLKSAGGGAGGKLLTYVANLKAIADGSLDVVAAQKELERTLGEEIAQRQKTVKLIQANDELADRFKDLYNNLGEFGNALQGINNRIDNLNTGLGDVLGGQGIKLRNVSSDLGLAPSRFTPDTQFGNALNSLLEPLGDAGKEIGQFVLDQRKAVALIDPILKSVARTSTATTLKGDVTNQLKGAGVSTQVIDNVIGRLEEFAGVSDGLEKVLVKLQTDQADTINKIKKDLLDFSSPLGTAGQQLDKLNANLYESAVKISQYNDKVREETSKIADITLQRQELGATRQAERFGGSPLNYISLAQQQEPFRARIRGLAGSENPEEIGRNIVELSKELPKLREEASNLKNDVAKTKFAELQTQIKNSEKALQLLASTTERSAKIEERLGLLRKQEEGRFDFFKRLVTAKPEEIPQLKQEIDAANITAGHLSRGGTLDQLPGPLRVAGASALSGPFGDFAFRSAGGRTGSDLLRQSFQQGGLPSFGLPAGLLSYNSKERAEKIGLEKQQDKVLNEAESAQKQLAIVYQNAVNQEREIFGKSVDIFKQSIDNFAKLLEQERSSYSNRPLKEGAQVLQNALGRQPTAADNAIIEKFRANKDEVLTAKNARDSIEKLNKLGSAGDITKTFSALPNALFRKDKELKDLAFNTNVSSEIEKITGGVIKSGEAQDIFEANKKRLIEQADAAGPRFYTFNRSAALENKNQLQKDLPETLISDTYKQLADLTAERKTGLEQTITNSRNRVGEGFDILIDKSDQFSKVIQSVDTSKFNDIINFLGSLSVGGKLPEAIGKAAGGSIFKPRGTDVVPAMLSPNEFIVNPVSAQANRPLLDRINATKGPVYLADGGEGSGKKRKKKKGINADLFVEGHLREQENFEKSQKRKNIYIPTPRSTLRPQDLVGLSPRERNLANLESLKASERRDRLQSIKENRELGIPQLSRTETGKVSDVLKEVETKNKRALELSLVKRYSGIKGREEYVESLKALGKQYKAGDLSPSIIRDAISSQVTGQRGTGFASNVPSKPELREIQKLEADLMARELADPFSAYYKDDGSSNPEEIVKEAVKKAKTKAPKKFTSFTGGPRKGSKNYDRYKPNLSSNPDYSAYGGLGLPVVSSANTGLFNIDPYERNYPLALRQRALGRQPFVSTPSVINLGGPIQDINVKTAIQTGIPLSSLITVSREVRPGNFEYFASDGTSLGGGSFPQGSKVEYLSDTQSGRNRVNDLSARSTDVGIGRLDKRRTQSFSTTTDIIQPRPQPITFQETAIGRPFTVDPLIERFGQQPYKYTPGLYGLQKNADKVTTNVRARASRPELLQRQLAAVSNRSFPGSSRGFERLGLSERVNEINNRRGGIGQGYLFDLFDPPAFQGPESPNISPRTQFLDFNGKPPLSQQYIDAQTERPNIRAQLAQEAALQRKFDQGIFPDKLLDRTAKYTDKPYKYKPGEVRTTINTNPGLEINQGEFTPRAASSYSTQYKGFDPKAFKSRTRLQKLVGYTGIPQLISGTTNVVKNVASEITTGAKLAGNLGIQGVKKYFTPIDVPISASRSGRIGGGALSGFGAVQQFGSAIEQFSAGNISGGVASTGFGALDAATFAGNIAGKTLPIVNAIGSIAAKVAAPLGIYSNIQIGRGNVADIRNLQGGLSRAGFSNLPDVEGIVKGVGLDAAVTSGLDAATLGANYAPVIGQAASVGFGAASQILKLDAEKRFQDTKGNYLERVRTEATLGGTYGGKTIPQYIAEQEGIIQQRRKFDENKAILEAGGNFEGSLYEQRLREASDFDSFKAPSLTEDRQFRDIRLANEREAFQIQLAQDQARKETERLSNKTSDRDLITANTLTQTPGQDYLERGRIQLEESRKLIEEFDKDPKNREYLKRVFGNIDYKAQGGSIFKKRGTDTIPAMLSPDEYVVNAASAKANKSILEQINSAKGPIYRASGGPISRKNIIDDTKKEIEKELKQQNVQGIARRKLTEDQKEQFSSSRQKTFSDEDIQKFTTIPQRAKTPEEIDAAKLNREFLREEGVTPTLPTSESLDFPRGNSLTSDEFNRQFNAPNFQNDGLTSKQRKQQRITDRISSKQSRIDTRRQNRDIRIKNRRLNTDISQLTPVGSQPSPLDTGSGFGNIQPTQAGAAPGAATSAPQAQAQQQPAFDVGGLTQSVTGFGGFVDAFGKHVSSLTDLVGKLTDLKVTIQTDKLTVTVAEKDLLTKITEQMGQLIQDKVNKTVSTGGPQEGGNV